MVEPAVVSRKSGKGSKTPPDASDADAASIEEGPGAGKSRGRKASEKAPRDEESAPRKKAAKKTATKRAKDKASADADAPTAKSNRPAKVITRRRPAAAQKEAETVDAGTAVDDEATSAKAISSDKKTSSSASGRGKATSRKTARAKAAAPEDKVAAEDVPASAVEDAAVEERTAAKRTATSGKKRPPKANKTAAAGSSVAAKDNRAASKGARATVEGSAASMDAPTAAEDSAASKSARATGKGSAASTGGPTAAEDSVAAKGDRADEGSVAAQGDRADDGSVASKDETAAEKVGASNSRKKTGSKKGKSSKKGKADNENADGSKQALSEDEQRYREVLSFLGDDIRSPVGVPRDYKPQDHSIHPLFRIDMGDYGGPLDLLVYLIRKHEIDIFDIPIRFLTERYLEMLDVLRALDIDVAAEFLVLAADLIHIKSKMLLPAKEGTPVDDEPEDASDPRSDLVRRLLEYQKYRDAAVELSDRDQLGRDVFARNPPSLSEQAEQIDPGLKQISIFKLVELMAGMMKQTPARHEISYDNFNIAERMHFVLRFGHAQGGRFMLIDLMDEVESRAELVVTFIAVLESTKLQLVRLKMEDMPAPSSPEIWPKSDAEPAADVQTRPDSVLKSASAPVDQPSSTEVFKDTEAQGAVESSHPGQAGSEQSGRPTKIEASSKPSKPGDSADMSAPAQAADTATAPTDPSSPAKPTETTASGAADAGKPTETSTSASEETFGAA
ncbi:MAG: segregation/condensation protein A, partial [Myxococcota bacterium]